MEHIITMRVKKITLLTLAVVLILSPVISFALRAGLERDSASIGDSLPLPDEVKYAVRPLVYVMIIDGAIGTVTDDRIGEAIKLAEDNNAELLVVFLDTPGGFTRPTWSICKKILNSNVPICTYIAPSGARAGSAGVYITYASHFAAMASSTNIGAAHPVSGGGKEVDSVMNEKITNDAVAQIKAAAEKRGRNAEWAEKAVRESVSITDGEALEMGVIDIRATGLDDLLSQIDGRKVDLPHGEKTMTLKDAKTETIETSMVHKLLQIITQPDIAFILFSIGSLGILLELYNPGSIFPGVVGAISLILAFYAFQTLPINYAGLALILLAILLFIAEVKIVSHGLLTIGGLISFFLGGLMLIDTVDPNLQISISVLVTMVICISAAVTVAAWLVIKAARNKPFIGNEGMIGKIAEVRKQDLVFVNGALWKAVSEGGDDLEPGSIVEITGVDKLTLKVRKANS
ncbi:MAG: nodulation protein NfeD [candidate division Zixibacteria bacterium]|nr:nodulation protein NfeD [candidate division Zixibacteria bacterium]